MNIKTLPIEDVKPYEKNPRRNDQAVDKVAEHAKDMLLGCAKSDTWISIEGSANFTANPRLEQNTVTNDRDLYRFHQTWMDDILSAPSKGDI